VFNHIEERGEEAARGDAPHSSAHLIKTSFNDFFSGYHLFMPRTHVQFLHTPSQKNLSVTYIAQIVIDNLTFP